MVNYLAALVSIMLLSLTSFSCDGRPAEEHMTQGKTKMAETNVELESVSLEAKISLQDKVLTVDYRIKNRSAKPIYLFNVLWEFSTDGKYVPAPQPFYSLFNDDATLHLAKIIPPLPKGKRVELKIVPFATKVAAGEDFSEKFQIPEPLVEYNPYFVREKDDSEELRTSESVVLTVQFVAEADEMEVKPAPLEGALTVWHANLSEMVRSLSSKPKAIMVKVKRRTDTFERF